MHGALSRFRAPWTSRTVPAWHTAGHGAGMDGAWRRHGGGRAGYGIFYDTIGVNRTPEVQTGYTATTPIQASLDNGLHFVATTANPFPNGLLAPQGSSAGLQTNLGQALTVYPDRKSTRLNSS